LQEWKGHRFPGCATQAAISIEFGNASTFVQTVEQPVVESSGRRFLESIGYDGIGEIEFKFDPRDSQYKILDANLRPWGWHTLGKAASIDFTYLLWQQKTGIDVAPITKHRKAAWVREITDVVAIAKSVIAARKSRRSSPLGPAENLPWPLFRSLILCRSSRNFSYGQLPAFRAREKRSRFCSRRFPS